MMSHFTAGPTAKCIHELVSVAAAPVAAWRRDCSGRLGCHRPLYMHPSEHPTCRSMLGYEDPRMVDLYRGPIAFVALGSRPCQESLECCIGCNPEWLCDSPKIATAVWQGCVGLAVQAAQWL